MIDLHIESAPIFARKDFVYDSIVSAANLMKGRGKAQQIELKSKSQTKAKLSIVSYAQDVLRLTVNFGNTKRKRYEPLLEAMSLSPIGFTDIEKEAKITKFVFGKYFLELHHNPFNIKIKTTQGKEIFTTHDITYNTNLPLTYSLGQCRGPGLLKESFISLYLDVNEHAYGLGEKFTLFDKRGTSTAMWNLDAVGTNTTDRTYKNVPFLVTTQGYGIFLNSYLRSIWEIGSYDSNSIIILNPAPILDFFLFFGDIKHILYRYQEVTGKGAMIPKWAFGIWLSRNAYRNREEIENVVKHMNQKKFPFDVISLDPPWHKVLKHVKGDVSDFIWNEENFGNEEDFINFIHQKKLNLCLWENPFLDWESEIYKEAKKKNYLVKTKSGKIARPNLYPNVLKTKRSLGMVDFSNPEAMKWWIDKHIPHLKKGVKVFKTDFGEFIGEDALFHNGMSGKEGHNLYLLWYQKAVYETVKKETNGFIFARSPFAGGQRFPVCWTGDVQATYYGMAGALRGILSLGLSGFNFDAHDIGGYIGSPAEDLYIRWTQFGLLSGISRFHGTSPREPWEFGKRALTNFRRYAKLRYKLMPYLYHSARESVRNSLPLMRPLVLEFPNDPAVRKIDTEYLLGNDLLVAPVLRPDNVVDLYLPEGEWISYWNKKIYEGRRYYQLKPNIFKIPLFIRNGAIIPTSPNLMRAGIEPFQSIVMEVWISGQKRKKFFLVKKFYDVDRTYRVTISIDRDRVVCKSRDKCIERCIDIIKC